MALPYPGDLLACPVTLAAALILIVNDRLLKPSHPGLVSGKLSDFVGLVMFPLVVAGVVELVRSRRRPDSWMVGVRTMWALVLVEGVLFAAIKLWTPAGDVYRGVVATGLWLMRVPFAVGDGWPSFPKALHIQDSTDLIALVVLPLPVLLLRRRGESGRAKPPRRTVMCFDQLRRVSADIGRRPWHE